MKRQLKTVKQWFEYFPASLGSRAINALIKSHDGRGDALQIIVENSYAAIDRIKWSKTTEGSDYWKKEFTRHYNLFNPESHLPVQSEIEIW